MFCSPESLSFFLFLFFNIYLQPFAMLIGLLPTAVDSYVKKWGQGAQGQS